MSEDVTKPEEVEEEQSFLKVIVHSFFIIPFLIAVFCLMLFAGIHLLTSENRTAYDYLEDIKTGSLNKRWQGAFELSKILANPKLLPTEERFFDEIESAFEKSKHDDDRVRQYLALAMGRTQRSTFAEPLVEALSDEKDQNLSALIYALGMLGEQTTAAAIHPYVTHTDARTRSIAVVALGNIQNPTSIGLLKKALKDQEPNVQWGSAISLAKMGDASGKGVLLKLLDRSYLEGFAEVDAKEQKHLMLAAIEAAGQFQDSEIQTQLENLSKHDSSMKIRAAALEIIKN